MEIIVGTEDFYINCDTAVAIGKFDGVHTGHRRLLEEIIKRKDDGLKALVFSFDPSPTVLFGKSDGKELSVREEKRKILERFGVDILVEFPLNFKTAAMPPEVFANEVLAERLNAKFVAAGNDLSFGAGGKGNAGLLVRMGKELGFSVKTIEKVCACGHEVSSSLIREFVEKGDMESAGTMLGIPYPIMGRVVHGSHIGRTIGFPTVNILPDKNKLLPPNGVYASDIVINDKIYGAISNVGYKPTVTDEKVMGVESYIYDFDEEVYGQEVEVYLKEFMRPEKKFESIEELRAQLDFDINSKKNTTNVIFR